MDKINNDSNFGIIKVVTRDENGNIRRVEEYAGTREEASLVTTGESYYHPTKETRVVSCEFITENLTPEQIEMINAEIEKRIQLKKDEKSFTAKLNRKVDKVYGTIQDISAKMNDIRIDREHKIDLDKEAKRKELRELPEYANLGIINILELESGAEIPTVVSSYVGTREDAAGIGRTESENVLLRTTVTRYAKFVTENLTPEQIALIDDEIARREEGKTIVGVAKKSINNVRSRVEQAKKEMSDKSLEKIFQQNREAREDAEDEKRWKNERVSTPDGTDIGIIRVLEISEGDKEPTIVNSYAGTIDETPIEKTTIFHPILKCDITRYAEFYTEGLTHDELKMVYDEIEKRATIERGPDAIAQVKSFIKGCLDTAKRDMTKRKEAREQVDGDLKKIKNDKDKDISELNNN